MQFQTLNFKSLYLDSNTSLLIKIETITISMFLSMRNKLVYSYSVKITYLGIPRTLGKHFLPPAGCGSVLPATSRQDA